MIDIPALQGSFAPPNSIWEIGIGASIIFVAFSLVRYYRTARLEDRKAYVDERRAMGAEVRAMQGDALADQITALNSRVTRAEEVAWETLRIVNLNQHKQGNTDNRPRTHTRPYGNQLQSGPGLGVESLQMDMTSNHGTEVRAPEQGEDARRATTHVVRGPETRG